MNAVARPFDMPPDKQAALDRAQRIEWASIAFLLSIVTVLGIVMGASQTMKALWVEDLLSMVPSISFLVGARFRAKPPDEDYPYGYRRAVLIGYLTGAVALFGFGMYILGDSIWKLIQAERPSIQSVELFGTRIWLGWLMLGALVYSVIPPFVLGRMKLPLAKELHDKVLHVSATLDKGDWLAGVAGILGLLGIAWGYWWADSVAAAIISLEIVKDGYIELHGSVAQLMNRRPTTVEDKERDDTVDRVQQALAKLPWIAGVRVRLREDGDVLTGEAFVQPRDGVDLKRLKQAREIANDVDWRLHEVNIVPVEDVEQ